MRRAFVAKCPAMTRPLFVVTLALSLSGSLLVAGLGGGCKKDEAAPAQTPAPGAEARKDEVKAPEPAPPPVAAPTKLVAVDCSAAGDAYKGWTITAPEGATCKEAFGALEIKAGDGFQVEVHNGKLDLAARKKEIEGNTVNKLKKYTTDTAEAIVYESDAMGKPEYHFLAARKVGDAEVSCEDTKGPLYSQAQVEAMLAACSSLAKK